MLLKSSQKQSLERAAVDLSLHRPIGLAVEDVLVYLSIVMLACSLRVVHATREFASPPIQMERNSRHVVFL